MAVNLTGLSTTKPKKETKEKPILPDPSGTLLPLVAQSIENKKHIDAHEGALASAKTELGKAAFAHACLLYHGRDAKIEDTFQIGTAAGKAIISLKNAYRIEPANVDVVRAMLGQHADAVLRESFVIKVDADVMPSFIQQAFVDELVKLARSFDAMLGIPEGHDGPVFQSIAAQPVLSVDKTFHEKRYVMFTPEENSRLHQVMPCQVAIKLDY